MPHKIALYGFGSMPVVYHHLITLAREQGLPLEWCMILTGPNYRSITAELLPKSEILDVYDQLPRKPKGGEADLLKGYVGSLAEDMAAQKRQVRRLSGQWLMARGIDYYQLYKSFLVARRATHLLTSGIETPDGKILIAAARELGLCIMAPVDLRSVTGTMFSVDALETPPAHAVPTPEDKERARGLIKVFRSTGLPARALPHKSTSDDQTLLPAHLSSLPARMVNFVRTAHERPDLFDLDLLRVSIMHNFGWIREPVRRTRAQLNAPKFHVGMVAALPRRFIFYPLQYTPESSINTPAPYYVDQFRAIDAIRFAMPNDCLLVVKEHPTCLEMRPLHYMRRMMRLPGVLVAKTGLPARSLIERAALTMTVTGTAALEAFLLGRPALTLGPSLCSWLLGRQASLRDLARDIAETIEQPLPDRVAVDRLATLINVRYPFFYATAHMPGEPMLRRGNMQRFLAGLLDHINRAEKASRTDETSTQSNATQAVEHAGVTL